MQKTKFACEKELCYHEATFNRVEDLYRFGTARPGKELCKIRNATGRRGIWQSSGWADTATIHNRMLRFQCMMELLDQPLLPHVKTLACTYWDTVLERMEPYLGVEELFRTLHESGIRIGVGTDMTAYIQYRKLEELGLAPYVDMVVNSEEAGVEKPDSKFFGLCVEKAGCPAVTPDLCLCVLYFYTLICHLLSP